MGTYVYTLRKKTSKVEYNGSVYTAGQLRYFNKLWGYAYENAWGDVQNEVPSYKGTQYCMQEEIADYIMYRKEFIRLKKLSEFIYTLDFLVVGNGPTTKEGDSVYIPKHWNGVYIDDSDFDDSFYLGELVKVKRGLFGVKIFDPELEERQYTERFKESWAKSKPLAVERLVKRFEERFNTSLWGKNLAAAGNKY
jgi:hypothetical protein